MGTETKKALEKMTQTEPIRVLARFDVNEVLQIKRIGDCKVTETVLFYKDHWYGVVPHSQETDKFPTFRQVERFIKAAVGPYEGKLIPGVLGDGVCILRSTDGYLMVFYPLIRDDSLSEKAVELAERYQYREDAMQQVTESTRGFVEYFKAIEEGEYPDSRPELCVCEQVLLSNGIKALTVLDET